MKYYLTIDKGPYETEKRYLKISLASLDKAYKTKLNSDNNLEAICNFTMNYAHPNLLRDELVTKKIISPMWQYRDLIITNYDPKVPISGPVPFKCYKPYFKVSTLSELIVKNLLTSPNFLKIYSSRFDSDCLHLVRFMKANKYIYIEEALSQRVKLFLQKYLYSNSKLNYRNLYTLGMFTASWDNIKDKMYKEYRELLAQQKAALIEEQETRLNDLNFKL